MQRIYVAGPYSANNIITCLDNMRRGMRAGLEVFLAGFSPWVPWHDFHHQLMLYENESLSVDDYYRYSMAWLEVSDAVLVLAGYEQSKGTIAEIKRAEELGIPVFYSLSELLDNKPLKVEPKDKQCKIDHSFDALALLVQEYFNAVDTEHRHSMEKQLRKVIKVWNTNKIAALDLTSAAANVDDPSSE